MADQQSNDTIRQMMAGFSAMQMNLGLLPMPQAQAMGGASSQFQTPPPPPQIAHPGMAAAQAMQQQQAMIQQTLQAAQVTRYQPPPSAPTPSVSAIAGFGAMNPFAAAPIGGGVGAGGGGGGGWGGGGGFAGPGAFAGGGGGMGGPRLPSVFNPFAPTLPQAHFASPAQRNLQLMQHAQSHAMGTAAGIGEAGLGFAGSMIGGTLGMALGPLGSLAGAWLGNKIGGAVSSLMFNPTTQDYARGRQVQQMTSPFMVSGAHLNTATGQGMDSSSARQVASGIRHLARDHDFERTGFNTQDVMRIMQTSASNGLLAGAQSPDQLVQKVKDISKTVKVLMKITGDPDVQSAIAALGEARSLGFQGLSRQAGAVAQRAQYARMAGVSQNEMGQIGMQGAAMAQGMGLVGATGSMAGMSGAANANLAVSSGALNDLQTARAGGQAGLGQINAAGQLAAIQDDRYMLAAMGRGPGGKMQVSMSEYRKAQTMSLDEVSQKAADTLRNMDAKGIFEWNTRRQEMKDEVAQKLKPGEAQMMMFRQAKAFQGKFEPGVMSLGTALQQTTGMSADQARALELQGNSRQYWEAQIQQLEVRKREAGDQLKAQREQYRTPGLLTRMRRGIGDALGSASDSFSSPYRSFADHVERVAEDDDAADHGERIHRFKEVDIARNQQERNLMKRARRERRVLGAPREEGNFLDQDESDRSLGGAFARAGGRQLNRMGNIMGLSSENSENRLVSIASRSEGSTFGWHPLESFGDSGEAMDRVKGLVGAARAATDSESMTVDKTASVFTKVGSAAKGKNINGGAVLNSMAGDVISKLKDLKAGTFGSATAISSDDMKDSYVKSAQKSGMSPKEAAESWNANKAGIMAHVAEQVYATGDKSIIEPFEKAKEAATDLGAVDLSRSNEEAGKDVERTLSMAGMEDVSDDTMGKVKAVVAQNDEQVVAVATALAARVSGNDAEKEGAERVLADLGKLDPQKQAELLKQANVLQKSMGQDEKDALELGLRGSVGLEGMTKTVGIAKLGIGKKLDLAARKEAMAKLGKVHTGAEGADSIEDAIGQITPEELERMPEKDRDLIKRAQAGDKAAIDEYIDRAGPTTTKTRHGGAEGSSVDDLDSMISEYKDMAAQATDTTTPEGAKAALEAGSTTLFATAVTKFEKAVETMQGGSESKALDWNNPNVISKLFPGG